MPIENAIVCVVCDAKAVETRSTFGGSVPQGWMKFEGGSQNAANLEVHLCPKCSPKASRKWNPLS
jgi:hypothetical protein